jgi:hemoglobin-like flavoprotein
MPITAAQVQVVQQTFMTRLFQLDPSLRPMFKGDMQEQGRKLMQMVGMAVQGLSVPNEITGLLADLGRKHVEYGVVDAHYDTVRTALLWTLRQGLGVDFTAEAETAWTEAYEFLAKVMKDAAAQNK